MSGFFGFYGKIPSKGDFVARGVPRDFTEPWDNWLQAAISSSRQQLHEHWLDQYLTSPIWRFALSAGICGSHHCVGVCMPSVDRVGRYFPFTLVRGYSPDSPILELFTTLDEWYPRLENHAMEALGDHLDLEDYFTALSGLSSPEPGPHAQRTAGQLSNGCYRLEPDGMTHLDQQLNNFREDVAEALFPAATLWSTLGSDRVKASLLIFDGLPDTSLYSSLLNGEWHQNQADKSMIHVAGREAMDE